MLELLSPAGSPEAVIAAVQNAAEHEAVLGSAVAVADANKVKLYMKNFGEFYNNQIETAACIVLSRTQGMKPEKLAAAVALIREHNQKAALVTTPWDELTGEQLRKAMETPDTLADMLRALEEEHHHHDYIMHAAYLFNRYGVPLDSLLVYASQIWSDYPKDERERAIRHQYKKRENHGTWNMAGKKKRAEDEEERGDHLHEESAAHATGVRHAVGTEGAGQIGSLDHIGDQQEEGAGDDTADDLSHPVAAGLLPAHAAGEGDGEGDGRIDVAAADFADGVGHGDHGETEGNGGSHHASGSAAAEEHRRSAAQECEDECAHAFSNVLLHTKSVLV